MYQLTHTPRRMNPGNRLVRYRRAKRMYRTKRDWPSLSLPAAGVLVLVLAFVIGAMI